MALRWITETHDEIGTIFDDCVVRISRPLIEELIKHTAAAEKKDGYNEFVEHALRAALNAEVVPVN